MSLDAMKQALEALERGETKLRYQAITALRAAIEQAQEPETELETYKRLYELRGKALERPCSNCGHQPAKIKAMAQPEQELVCVCGAIWEDQELVSTPLPRQWQGLTADEIWDEWCKQTKPERDTRNFVAAFALAIETKLRAKNT